MTKLILKFRHPRMSLSGIHVNQWTWIPAFAGMTLIVGLSFILPCRASSNNVGTSGAAFLKIGVGARPVAMGDSFVAIADDANAAHYNPAGLTQLKKNEFTAMHSQWIEGMSYDYGAIALPSSNGTWGFSAATLETDGITRRSEDETDLGTFQNIDGAYTLSFAHPVGELFSIGLNGRLVQQKIDSTSAKAWGGDVGVLYRSNNSPWTAGVALKNMGQSIKFNQESDPQPMTADVGAGARLFKNRLTAGVNVLLPRDNKVSYGLGAEWQEHLGHDMRIAARAGTNSSITDPTGATGISLGAGFGFRLMDFDFAWVPFGNLGNTFRYSATVRF